MKLDFVVFLVVLYIIFSITCHYVNVYLFFVVADFNDNYLSLQQDSKDIRLQRKPIKKFETQ